MSLKIAIERAAAIAGSQRSMAAAMGVNETWVSNWKNGSRPCGVDKRIRIYQMAGMDPTIAVLEGLADQLDENDEWQGRAKETLNAILNAFPETETEPDESQENQVSQT